MIRYLACLILGFTLTAAHADGGLFGSGARYANVVGMQGALQNRAAANALYRQSIRDERESRRTHDHGLHRKAVGEAVRARAADGQGRAFARAALQAFTATLLSGQVKQSEAKDVDVAQLREIAHAPNAMEQEIKDLLDERELAANDVGEGEFETGNESEKPSAVSAEKEAEPATRTRAPATATANTLATPNAPGASGSASFAGGGSGGASTTLAKTPTPNPVAPNIVAVAVNEAGGGGGPSRNERADQIERDRKTFLKKMGVGKVSPAEVRAEKEANIFEVVHTRYQIMRGDNNFMEYLERPELAARGPWGR